MLHYLGGGFEHDAKEYYGQKVMSAEILKADDKSSSWDRGGQDRLRLGMSGGKFIEIWDSGQSCCESRYMTTDDDVKSLVGGTLTRIEAKPGPDTEAEYDVHEQVFVEVGTDKGFITVVNHNEHNGYYGGFGLTITEAE